MKKVWRALETAVTTALVVIIRVYQYTLGPLMPMTCRFEPSCSRYAVEALQKHGPWRGVALATWRVIRCNPFNHGGYDPVP
jgi:putative membrane protein insertion efficiency factor